MEEKSYVLVGAPSVLGEKHGEVCADARREGECLISDIAPVGLTFVRFCLRVPQRIRFLRARAVFLFNGDGDPNEESEVKEEKWKWCWIGNCSFFFSFFYRMEFEREKAVPRRAFLLRCRSYWRV